MNTRLRYLYRAYRYRYLLDRAELRFMSDRLQRGQVAVDVGCHKGAYTYWMRRRVGVAGAVFAVEPQPRQVAYLREVFSAMRYDNVVLVPAGLSDAPGKRALYIPKGAGQTHEASFERGEASPVVRGSPDPAPSSTDGLPLAAEGRPAVAKAARSGDRPQHGVGDGNSCSLLPAPCSVLPVDVTTLDAISADQPRGPDFIKIDVEGHESAVLAGGRHTLAKYRPTLLIECEARHRPDGDVRPVFEFLQSLGYEGSFFQAGQRRPLAEFDPAKHQPGIADTAEPPRGYVNNFAFEPRNK